MKRSKSAMATERMWLREIDETDGDCIVSLRSDEDVYRYFLNPVKLTIQDHLRWYKETYCNDRGRIDWIAVDDENGDFIGVYGAKISGEKGAEISYITAKEQRGRGYAKEAVEAVMNWCEKKWDISLFYVLIHVDNKASISFARQLGFSKNDENGAFVRMIRKG